MPSPAGSGTLQAACGSLSQGLSQGFQAFRLISMLVHQLGTWISHTLRACGENQDWETLRRILHTHSLVTTVLPLRDGRLLRIHKASLADPEQALRDQHLGMPWKDAFRPKQSYANGKRFCSASANNP
jgi:hypothetical protein